MYLSGFASSSVATLTAFPPLVIVVVVHLSVAMLLRFYLDNNGKRVYTLKQSVPANDGKALPARSTC